MFFSFVLNFLKSFPHANSYYCFPTGTIDKDYPKRKGGYAFEIGPSAAKTILINVQPTINLEFQTVCLKDSQDITDEER